MFSGIVQNQGLVTGARKRGKDRRLTIRFKKREDSVCVGESIAVNGVCLTAARADSSGFECDVVAETLKSTTLGTLRQNDCVNLERSLRYGDPVSGHFVSGHVDGAGSIRKIEKKGGSYLFYIEVPENLLFFAAPKGSVAVDGVSLTIQSVVSNTMKIAIIPHTFKVTNFRARKAGDKVNLEVDMLARYALRGEKAGAVLLDEAFLRKQGF